MVTLSPLVSILLFLPPFATMLFLPIPTVVSLFIVLGQGHFIGAYIYQFLAGRLAWWKVVLYASLFVLLWAMFINTRSLNLLLALTAVVFSAHFIWDSSRILGNRELLPAVITRLPPFMFFSAFVVERIYGTQLILFATLFTVLMFGVYIFCIALKRFRYDASDLLFIGGTFGFWLLITINQNLSTWIAFGFIILYHYIQWYVFYWKRCANDKEKLHKYIRNILISNAVAILAFFFWKISNTSGVMKYFFEPEHFYLWTLVHIVSCIRFKYH